MFLNFKYHYKIIIPLLFIILIGCQIQDPEKNHGILFLENRANKLVLNKSNKNDVIRIIGQPHSKSINSENIWIYLERTLTKGKYYKFGRHVLKTNNTLVLTFNKYGVLETKKFYSRYDLNKIAFSENKTENKLSEKSFIESFLTSIREKMYGGRK